MLDHATFSALRLRQVFPPEYLEEYPWYSEMRPDGKGFDTEYMGGLWHEEVIDGVQFWYPRVDGNKLGIIELWAAAAVQGSAARDKPEPNTGTLVPPWTANANRVLEALDLPLRMGDGEAAVRALAAGSVFRSGFPDGAKHSLQFACRAPDVYHMAAVVHAANGLLKLEIRRADVVRANDPEGAYDTCFADVHDEGLEES